MRPNSSMVRRGERLELGDVGDVAAHGQRAAAEAADGVGRRLDLLLGAGGADDVGAHARRSASAMPRPMPRPAPVTIATLSVSAKRSRRAMPQRILQDGQQSQGAP